MEVMDRIETLEYLKNKWSKDERLVVSRYSDGEYLLMNNMAGHVAESSSKLMSNLLIKAISMPGQLVCINYLKPHNTARNDIWCRVQEYLSQTGGQDIYGCCNWNVYDFSNDNELLAKLFKGNVLLVAGLADEASDFFKDIQPNMAFYKTPSKGAVLKYKEIRSDILSICDKYKTIIFACGPISKVLTADFIDRCECNLIDMGAVLNAILNMTNKWPMSWAKGVDIENQIKKLCEGIV